MTTPDGLDILDMPTYDSQDIEIPFQNAYRGPAGEYSDAYKAIVDQYRNELASADELRQEQKREREIQQYIDSGLRPPSMMRQAMQRMPQPRYLKDGAGNWFEIPTGGSPKMVIDSPDKPPPIPRPSQWENERVSVAGRRVSDLQKEMIGARPSRMEALKKEYDLALKEFNQLQPAAIPGLAPPPIESQQQEYRPASMIAPGEVLPANAIVMRGANKKIDAPPSTTQNNEVIRTLKNGRKAVFDGTTKKFLRYAQ